MMYEGFVLVNEYCLAETTDSITNRQAGVLHVATTRNFTSDRVEQFECIPFPNVPREGQADT